MRRNVEIKARIPDLAALERRVAAIADGGPEILVQDDLFFATQGGRLKLRRFPDGSGELIWYERSDRRGPRTSCYAVHRTGDAAGLAAVLSRSLGTCGRVRKRRRLYLAGATRIHLDRVEHLGEFVELEVVLDQGQTEAAGIGVARDLMTELGIAESDLVDRAYVDLLGERANPGTRAGSEPRDDRE